MRSQERLRDRMNIITVNSSAFLVRNVTKAYTCTLIRGIGKVVHLALAAVLNFTSLVSKLNTDSYIEGRRNCTSGSVNQADEVSVLGFLLISVDFVDEHTLVP